MMIRLTMMVKSMMMMVKQMNDDDEFFFIGQRDKPFVSEADMAQRTPRPDILTVPPNSNYYDGLKEAETKVNFPTLNKYIYTVFTIRCSFGQKSRVSKAVL